MLHTTTLQSRAVRKMARCNTCGKWHNSYFCYCSDCDKRNADDKAQLLELLAWGVNLAEEAEVIQAGSELDAWQAEATEELVANGYIWNEESREWLIEGSRK